MRRVLVMLGVVFAVASLAVADAPRNGLVTGTVAGPDGAPMAGATVQLQSGRGAESVVTGEDGKFQFNFVIPGAYTVRADLTGFQPAAGEIVVSAGGRYDVDLELQEAMGEEILVTGEVPLVNRYDVTGGGTLSEKALETVTGGSLIYKSWISQLPGAFDDRESMRYANFQPVIEGVEGTRQMYFVDGVDATFTRWTGSTMLQVPATAVQELKLEATGADAGFSRTVGSYVSVVTKSGTNQFHGHATYMPFNADWGEPQDLFPAAAPDEVHHNWEASLSGPFVKDKLWFYALAQHAYWPGAVVLGNGVDVVDMVADNKMYLFKLDWRPSQSHAVTLNYMDTPQEFPWWNESVADYDGVAYFAPAGGDLQSLRWSWAVQDDLFLEAHLATTEANRETRPYREPDIDPACREDSPCGNAWRYVPYDGDRLMHNGTVLGEGFGPTDYPRDQANLSVNWFTGRHDIKAGLDYQQTSLKMSGVVPPYCQGFGYIEWAPGGFGWWDGMYPVYCAFIPTKATWADGYGPIELDQTNAGLFVRDRITANRWAFNVGVRADNQVHKNAEGVTVLDTTDWVPRLSASYDVSGDGSMLLNASAGRYILQMPQMWALRFSEAMHPGQYEVWLWDWATWSGYDTYSYTFGFQLDPVEVAPSYKDEYTLGFDWQFSPNWAAKAKAVYWERGDYPAVTAQVIDGVPTQVAGNISGAGAERTALNLSVQRRFADNWTVLAAYTWSKTEGNCDYTDDGGGAYIGGGCGGLGFHEQFVNQDGIPYSRVNRWGRLATDRPHNFKVSGSYLAPLGRGHTLNLGGGFFIQSGEPYALIATVVEPYTQQGVGYYLEPRGSRRNPSVYQLNANLGWSFPIKKQVTGEVRLDINNVTNAQELIGAIGRATPPDGDPFPTSLNYQTPRYYRIEVKLTF